MYAKSSPIFVEESLFLKDSSPHQKHEDSPFARAVLCSLREMRHRNIASDFDSPQNYITLQDQASLFSI